MNQQLNSSEDGKGDTQMDMDVTKLFQKAPAWLTLVFFGIVCMFVASRPSNFTFLNVPIGLDGLWRYAFTILGGALIICGLFLALLSGGLFQGLTEARGASEPLPVKEIHIDTVQHSPSGDYKVSGHVEPKKKGVTVWLVRESLDQKTGRFTPSPYNVVTLADGTWEQSIHLWKGKFRIHAVVTTEQFNTFYRWYHDARQAALDIARKQDPKTTTVQGWPNLDSLPENCHSDLSREITV